MFILLTLVASFLYVKLFKYKVGIKNVHILKQMTLKMILKIFKPHFYSFLEAKHVFQNLNFLPEIFI